MKDKYFESEWAELGLGTSESGSRAGGINNYQGVCILWRRGGGRGDAIKGPGIEGCLEGFDFGFA